MAASFVEPSVSGLVGIDVVAHGSTVRLTATGEIDSFSAPALARAQEARVETPVVARAEGLGPHPFTRPEQPDPPEGSVL